MSRRMREEGDCMVMNKGNLLFPLYLHTHTHTFVGKNYHSIMRWGGRGAAFHCWVNHLYVCVWFMSDLLHSPEAWLYFITTQWHVWVCMSNCQSLSKVKKKPENILKLIIRKTQIFWLQRAEFDTLGTLHKSTKYTFSWTLKTDDVLCWFFNQVQVHIHALTVQRIQSEYYLISNTWVESDIRYFSPPNSFPTTVTLWQ